MKEIILMTGHITQVSDIDFDLNVFNWNTAGKYVTRREGKLTIYLHHVIVARIGLIVPLGHEIDHEDRNKLNNQRENLRIVTASINQHNTGERVDNTSGYKGVNYSQFHKKWAARISIKGTRKNLGHFDTFEQAVEARKKAEKKYGTG